MIGYRGCGEDASLVSGTMSTLRQLGNCVGVGLVVLASCDSRPWRRPAQASSVSPASWPCSLPGRPSHHAAPPQSHGEDAVRKKSCPRVPLMRCRRNLLSSAG